MVNYHMPTYVPTTLLRKDSSSRMSTASTASASTIPDAMWATSGLSGGGFQTDYGHSPDASPVTADAAGSATGTGDAPYFRFSDAQQDALLLEGRANAAALVVDVLSDFDKWQFVAAKGSLNVFELRADAADRVSSMVPPSAPASSSSSARSSRSPGAPSTPTPGRSPLALHMHTMLGMTRVRAKLDDFMRVFSSARREAFQDVQTCLFEDRVQLADVFTSFGSTAGSRRPSAESLASSRGPQNPSNSQEDVDMEQFAVKYLSLKPIPSKQLSASASSSASLSSSGSSIKFGSSRGHRRRQRSAPIPAEQDANQGLTVCVGEYATIRRGHVRAAPAADSLAASGRGHRSQSSSSSSSSGREPMNAIEDHRVGIIAQHSMEDPAVTRFCKPIVLSDPKSSSSSSSTSNSSNAFAFASRSLVQFSGLVVYPVAPSTTGESVLEVLIKLSVYDPRFRGVTPSTRLNMLAFVSAFQQLENALLVMRLRESPFLSSRNWVRSRSRKCCYLCQAGFSSFRRKHHCRLCGEVTCSKCSDVLQVKLGRAGKCPFRICAQCVHGADESFKLQRRRGSSNEDSVRIGGGRQQVQPQDEEEEEDEDEADDDDAENDPARRRDQFAPPDRGLDRTGSARHTGLDSSSMRKMAVSTSSNASTRSGSSGSELYDSRGLLAPGNGRAQQQESGSRTAASAVTLTTLSMASSATTARSTTGSDQSPTRYGTYAPASSSASASSSPASPGSAVLSEDGDSFYERFSEMSLRDFHDSEFDLSLKGMGMAGRPTGFEFDDSERGSDNELDDIGEEDDDEQEFDLDEREVDIDAAPLASTRRVPSARGPQEFQIDDVDEDDGFPRESGMEFHDSEVGIEFDVSEFDVDHHLGGLIDEEVEEEHDDLDDSDEDVDEVIETSAGHRAMMPSHGSLAVLDQIRAARLAEYGILDSGKEHIYDVVARQAAQHLDCALGTVSFVDARREYVKAAFGVPLVSHDIAKAHSLTAAIMRRCLLEDRDVVVVSDARADDLLSANKFVYEAPFVRFAVGIPIKAASDGTILGALVVADPRPRSREVALSASHERMLRDLVEQVSALLEDRLARTLGSSSNGSGGAGGARGPGQMREKLADLLSQSYHTGLQVQQNEHKILSSSGSAVSMTGSSSSSSSRANALSSSMLGGSGSGSGALSASMLGGSSSGARFNRSGTHRLDKSGSRLNQSGSRFNPSGSHFDASESHIRPKFHAASHANDDYSHMGGIEL